MNTSFGEYQSQGRSNNYIAAVEAGKLTVGQAAKFLTKKFGEKIVAKQLEPLAVEYHHAGLFNGRSAKRVFFLTRDFVETLTREKIEAANGAQTGWQLGFKRVVGLRGRITFVPVIAKAGTFSAAEIKRLGKKFNRVTAEEVEEIQKKIEAGANQLPAFETDWRKAF